MIELSSKEYAALAAICDALLPSIDMPRDSQGYWKRTAGDLNVADRVIELIAHLPVAEHQKFKKLCKTLASPWLGLTWLGPFKAADQLSQAQRTLLLQRWASSPLADLRNGFSSLKKLSGFFYFAGIQADGKNPNWQSLGYPGPPPFLPLSSSTLPVNTIDNDTSLDCDVLVIGSGAGGSVVAAELAQAGQSVIVLEKGPYLQPKAMSQQEETMMQQMYEARAGLVSTNGSIGVLAGSCLGGGTTINWAGAFRTPGYVLEEWATAHQNPHFITDAFQKSFEIVEQRCHINTRLLRHNAQNQALLNGAGKLGYLLKNIPRNVRPPVEMQAQQAWEAQGFSPYGDRYGIKQGAVETFLADAVEAGARLFPDTYVEQIIIKNAKALGAYALHTSPSGRVRQLKIVAKKVILAAGAIHSPAVLKRSGLTHLEIGRNLYLHPTTAVSAAYSEPVESWYGPMMSAVCDEFVQLDGNFGCKIETPPAHPGLMATALSWQSGEQFKTDMLKARHMANFIIITRDKFAGQLIIDRRGQPQPGYRLHKYDRGHMLRGIQEAVRIHAAAAAQQILVLHNQYYKLETANGDLEEFVQHIPRLNWGRNRYFLASAHQMGSCRMGGSDRLHPVKPDGEVRGAKNLYVADASLFPSASGANPMLSVQALAWYIAQGLK